MADKSSGQANSGQVPLQKQHAIHCKWTWHLKSWSGLLGGNIGSCIRGLYGFHLSSGIKVPVDLHWGHGQSNCRFSFYFCVYDCSELEFAVFIYWRIVDFPFRIIIFCVLWCIQCNWLLSPQTLPGILSCCHDSFYQCILKWARQLFIMEQMVAYW